MWVCAIICKLEASRNFGVLVSINEWHSIAIGGNHIGFALDLYILSRTIRLRVIKLCLRRLQNLCDTVEVRSLYPAVFILFLLIEGALPLLEPACKPCGRGGPPSAGIGQTLQSN